MLLLPCMYVMPAGQDSRPAGLGLGLMHGGLCSPLPANSMV